MFPNNYFGGRYFAARYWPKTGGVSIFNPAWAQGSNRTVGFGIAPQ